ncbi:MAG: aspartate kinase [Bacteroidetes bacterium]|nr:MAG: aspartate kinase [Bacteroidota bacterium]TNE96877.1 MAG: aspartate kinase [Bacteroidota bacterium]
MKVFKFGGASVKDAGAVKNVAKIIGMFPDQQAVVISAMGKTTNALEEVVQALWNRDEMRFTQKVDEIRSFHLQIMNELFADKDNAAYADFENEITQLRSKYNERIPDNYDFEYDQIVSKGEVISTKIVAHYLTSIGESAAWTDARELIRTDNNYRNADINWQRTEELFAARFTPLFSTSRVLIIQGFIGHTAEGFTTTLGREGSDFTAAIVAYCTNAESVTIWKDVPGMLNADPKWFDNTIKLDKISFKEAIELSYYGASVIHPKTVKPLQNKQIPLYVNSFLDPEKTGTVIQADQDQDHLIPSFIFKMNQVLVSITPKDFSFIVEKNLSDIFERLSSIKAKINLMQNSALNFSVLLDEEKTDIDDLLKKFEDHYLVKYNTGLELITIRHYDQPTIDRVTTDKEVLLEQKTRDTARIIVKDLSKK